MRYFGILLALALAWSVVGFKTRISSTGLLLENKEEVLFFAAQDDEASTLVKVLSASSNACDDITAAVCQERVGKKRWKGKTSKEVAHACTKDRCCSVQPYKKGYKKCGLTKRKRDRLPATAEATPAKAIVAPVIASSKTCDGISSAMCQDRVGKKRWKGKTSKEVATACTKDRCCSVQPYKKGYKKCDVTKRKRDRLPATAEATPAKVIDAPAIAPSKACDGINSAMCQDRVGKTRWKGNGRPRPTSRSFDPDLARRTFLGSASTINTLFSGSQKDNGPTRRQKSKTLFNRAGSGGEMNTYLAENIGSQPFNPAHYRQGSKHAHRSSGDLQPALRNESVDRKYVAYADYRKLGPVSSRCRSVLRTFQAGDGLRTLVNACGAEGPCKFCHSAGNRNLDVCQAVRAKAPTVSECRSLRR